MKPISLTKTMPWLLGASAVFTLAFSQNVSAQNSSSQTASVKRVQNTQANQYTSRMDYLNKSAKGAIGDPTAKLPTNDGLYDYHDQVNAYLYRNEPLGSEKSRYEINYALGEPKVFNDPTLKDDQNSFYNDYAYFSMATWQTFNEAEERNGHESPSNYQNNPQVDLGNGISAYKVITDADGDYEYSLVWYQGPYEITVTNNNMSGESNDPQTWSETITLAKKNIEALKQFPLPQTNGGGIIIDQDHTNITWQDGNRVYNSFVSVPNRAMFYNTKYKVDILKSNLKMVNSIQ